MTLEYLNRNKHYQEKLSEYEDKLNGSMCAGVPDEYHDHMSDALSFPEQYTSLKGDYLKLLREYRAYIQTVDEWLATCPEIIGNIYNMRFQKKLSWAEISRRLYGKACDRSIARKRFFYYLQ